MKQIKKEKGLVGKIIKGVASTDCGHHLILIFEDNTYCFFEGNYSYEDDYEVSIMDVAPDSYDLLHAGIITEKEYNKKVKATQRRLEKRREEAEIKVYERLKTKFEKKT